MNMNEVYKDLQKKIDLHMEKTTLMEVPKLKRIEIEVTSECNIRCKYCYLGDEKNVQGYMSFEEAKNIIDMAYHMDVERIYFTGGEPLLNKNIMQMIDYSTSKGFKEVCLVTNGSLIDSTTAIELAKYPLNIAIGIMTNNNDNGKKLHGDLFDEMKQSVIHLKNAGFSNEGDHNLIAIGASIMNDNVEDVLNFHQWVVENGIIWSGIEPFVITGDGEISQFPDLETVKTITLELAAREGLNTENSKITPFCLTNGCSTFSSRLYIKKGGVVKLCGPGFVLGHLEDMTLMEIWEKHPLLIALRNFKKLSNNNCSQCESECIGCPITTFNLTGDFLNAYPLCWHINKNGEN